jgi:hypothetical protein
METFDRYGRCVSQYRIVAPACFGDGQTELRAHPRSARKYRMPQGGRQSGRSGVDLRPREEGFEGRLDSQPYGHCHLPISGHVVQATCQPMWTMIVSHDLDIC